MSQIAAGSDTRTPRRDEVVSSERDASIQKGGSDFERAEAILPSMP
jgi:hypothetical protein